MTFNLRCRVRGPEPTRPLYSQRAEHSPERESKSRQILREELLVGNIWGGVYVNVLVKGQDMMCLEGRVSVLVRFVDLIQTQTYLGRGDHSQRTLFIKLARGHVFQVFP